MGYLTTVATAREPVVIHHSSGEMGDDNEIIAVEVERQPDGRLPGGGTDDCPPRTAHGETTVVALGDGIRFGASSEAVMRRLGRPSTT